MDLSMNCADMAKIINDFVDNFFLISCAFDASFEVVALDLRHINFEYFCPSPLVYTVKRNHLPETIKSEVLNVPSVKRIYQYIDLNWVPAATYIGTDSPELCNVLTASETTNATYTEAQNDHNEKLQKQWSSVSRLEQHNDNPINEIKHDPSFKNRLSVSYNTPYTVWQTGPVRYICNMCNAFFIDQSSLNVHKFNHSTVKSFQCITCQEVFTTNYFLKKHLKVHLSQTIPFSNPVRGDQFSENGSLEKSCQIYSEDLRTHSVEMSQTQAVWCEPSNRKTTKTNGNSNAADQMINAKMYSCNVCNQLFMHWHELTSHLTTHNKADLYTYIEYNKSFIWSKDNFENHSAIHSDQEPYICKECHKSFTSRRSFKKHLQIHADCALSFKCNICNKSFKQFKYMLTHFRSHFDEKRHECIICNKAYVSKSTLKRHFAIHSPERLQYPCTKCSKVFRSRHSLKCHYLVSHSLGDDKPFACKICTKSFRLKIYLNAHSKTHSQSRPYICTVCNKAFKTKKNRKRHQVTHSSERPYSCSTCHKSFASNDILKAHIMTHSTEKPYACPICNKTFALRNYLYTHAKVHSREVPYTCTICNAKFETRTEFYQHRSAHISKENASGVRSYLCTICNTSVSRKHQLRIHYRTHWDEKPYACTICNRSFRSNSNLKAHLWTHSTEKRYACSRCKKAFPTRSKLLEHKSSTHTFEKPHSASPPQLSRIRPPSIVKPFRCDECGKTFRKSRALDAHNQRYHHAPPTQASDQTCYTCEICKITFDSSKALKTHHWTHTAKPHSCEICSKSFTSTGYLKLHRKTHSGATLFPCQICNRTFASNSILRTHQKDHFGERSHLCTTCNRSFSTSTALKNHYTCHTGEKPHTCATCNKSYTTSSSLKVHMKCHSGEKLYKCSTCGEAFITSFHMRRHSFSHIA